MLNKESKAMINILTEYFKETEYTWKINGQDVTPSQEDVKTVLGRAVEILKDEPVGTQLEVGRLIIIKTHDDYDIYVFAGVYKDLY